MWGFSFRLLAVIGVLTGAVVTASAFVPGAPRVPVWPAQVALVVSVPLMLTMMFREHGRFP
jgi:hypothetical protein